MRLGLGLYREMLATENFRFARQAGATDIVAHLVDYASQGRTVLPAGVEVERPLWTYEELRDLRAAVNAEGLELAALENFEPAHWSDVLLDGPRKAV